MALCLVSAFGFGCMAIFAKDAYKQHLGITALLALRFALAALIFWAIARTRAASPFPPAGPCSPPSASAPFGYAAQSGLYFGAVKRMDASTTALLLYTYPAIVFIAALALRREHADRRRLGALALAVGGTALLLLGGGGSGSFETVGVVMALVRGGRVLDLHPRRRHRGREARPVPARRARGHRRRHHVLASPAPSTAGSTSRSRRTAGSTSPGSSWCRRCCRSARSSSASSASARRRASILSCFEPVVTVSLAMALYGERLGPGAARGRRAGSRRRRPAAG